MTQYDYNKLLKYLCVEGYVDSYEEAELIVENMSIIEQRKIILELNRQAKEEGRGKTPLHIGIPKGPGRVVKDPETGKHTIVRHNRPEFHPSASAGRMKQGMDTPESHRGTSEATYRRHPHGGKSLGKGEIGSQRGVKKQKGVKPGTNIINKKVVRGPKAEDTPVQKFKREKQRNIERQMVPYNKYFKDYNQPKATRLDLLRKRKQQRMAQNEAYELLFDYLLDEGYTITVEGAVTIIENMSEDWIVSILEAYKKLPVGKMMRKVEYRAEREADTRADVEREGDDPNSTFGYDRAVKAHREAERNKERSNRMINIADTHRKKEAKAKSRYKG